MFRVISAIILIIIRFQQMSKINSQRTTRIIGSYKYKSQDVLGKGYSSTVYRGRNTINDQLVALKVIERDSKNKAFLDDMIKLEIQALKDMIGKPNILKLIDVKQTKNRTYIITNYCKGGTLKQYLDKKGKLNEQEAFEYFKQIVIGYESIQQAKLLHRDLKPANIFMVNDKDIQIGDFGFAIPINQVALEDTLIIGSPMYMPYEALKKRQYTQKGDIWALGITFFQLLNGSAPFKARNEKELINTINRIKIEEIIPKNFSLRATKLLTMIIQHHKQKRATIRQIKEFLFNSTDIQIPYSIVIKRVPKLVQQQSDNRHQIISKSKSNSKEPSIVSTKSVSVKQESILTKTIPSQNNSVCSARQKSLWSQASENEEQSDRFIPIQESTIKLNQAELKKISAHLICQIHFCRFCYKLARRMMKHAGQDSLEQHIIGMTLELTFLKLNQILELVGVNQMYAEQYKYTRYYSQIQGIVKQYTFRYIKQLGETLNKKYWENLRIFQRSLVSQILRIFNIVYLVKNPGSKAQLIITLDYLITLKQLVKLLPKGIEQFQKCSKIEKIVQGRPTTDINQQHVKAIKLKLRKLNLF